MSRFLFFILLLIPSVVNASGIYTERDGVSYILDTLDKTAKVVYGLRAYSGDVVVPEEVKYENETYQDSNPLNNYQKLYINGNEVKDLVIPEDVERISSWAFTGCQSINSVTVSSGVKEIGNNAFYGCYSLESISLPNTLKAIGNSAFASSHITSLIIPSSVDTIGYSIIGGCLNFEILKVDVGNKSYDSRNNCNAIIKTLTNTIVQGCDKTKIPKSVTSIGDYAFDGCNIYDIEIPNNVTEIGKYAFRNSFLNTIDIPNNLQYIGTGAFYNCQNLRSVYLPENMKKVCDNTFYGCKNLSTIRLPAEITEIGDCAFMSCETLYYIILPNTITHIGKNAFDYTGWYNVQNDGILYLNNWIVGVKNYYEEGEFYLDGAMGIADGVFENLWWPYETKLIIPQSIKYLGNYSLGTFMYTMDVYCYANEIPITDGDPFYYYEESNCTLHVPANLLDLYKSTEPWSSFENIVPLTDYDPKSTYIQPIPREDETPIVIYTLDGRQISKPQRGLNILLMRNNMIKKIVKK